MNEIFKVSMLQLNGRSIIHAIDRNGFKHLPSYGLADAELMLELAHNNGFGVFKSIVLGKRFQRRATCSEIAEYYAFSS